MHIIFSFAGYPESLFSYLLQLLYVPQGYFPQIFYMDFCVIFFFPVWFPDGIYTSYVFSGCLKTYLGQKLIKENFCIITTIFNSSFLFCSLGPWNGKETITTLSVFRKVEQNSACFQTNSGISSLHFSLKVANGEVQDQMPQCQICSFVLHTLVHTSASETEHPPDSKSWQGRFQQDRICNSTTERWFGSQFIQAFLSPYGTVSFFRFINIFPIPHSI